jgi:hypothetical protein
MISWAKGNGNQRDDYKETKQRGAWAKRLVARQACSGCMRHIVTSLRRHITCDPFWRRVRRLGTGICEGRR